MIPTHTNTYHPIGAPHFRKTFFLYLTKLGEVGVRGVVSVVLDQELDNKGYI